MGAHRSAAERYGKRKRTNVHVWIWIDDNPHAGIVLEWRKNESLRWDARVVFTDALDLKGGSTLIERWMPEQAVTQAPTPDPDGIGRPY